MKLKIIASARHRNGVAGAPFDVVLFKVLREPGLKVGVLFDAPDHCAVLDVAKLASGDIAFGSNSWRGDDYEPALRQATAQGPESGQAAVMNGDALIRQRVDKCAATLRRYSDDGVFTSLIDLLPDAMHCSDATGEDFHYAICLAGKHYVAELNDQQLDERRLP